MAFDWLQAYARANSGAGLEGSSIGNAPDIFNLNPDMPGMIPVSALGQDFTVNDPSHVTKGADGQEWISKDNLDMHYGSWWQNVGIPALAIFGGAVGGGLLGVGMEGAGTAAGAIAPSGEATAAGLDLSTTDIGTGAVTGTGSGSTLATGGTTTGTTTGTTIGANAFGPTTQLGTGLTTAGTTTGAGLGTLTSTLDAGGTALLNPATTLAAGSATGTGGGLASALAAAGLTPAQIAALSGVGGPLAGLGSLATGITGLIGASKLNKPVDPAVVNTLDPFAPQRAGYQQQLLDVSGQIDALLKDPSSVTKLPGYQFNFDQGMMALNNSMASKGLGGSGNMGVAEIKYGQDYATNAFNQDLGNLENRFNNLLGPSGANINTSALSNNMPNPQTPWQLAGTSMQSLGYGIGAVSPWLSSLFNGGG